LIHLLLLLDRKKSVGLTLYDNGNISLHADLLIGLVQALMLLGEELGESKGPLREAELGKYQIAILSHDHLAYVAVQDTYDSEPFTRRILESVIEKYHDNFVVSNLNFKLTNEFQVKNDVAELLRTMKFPMDMIPELNPLVNEFLIATNDICDTFMLADLDDGIVTTWKKPEREGIIKILMEILSEIPFEKSWIGETKLIDPIQIRDKTRSHEAWFISRIGLTDFCLMGRAYYNPGMERDMLASSLEEIAQSILDRLMNSGKLSNL
jgi:hypothetical protein